MNVAIGPNVAFGGTNDDCRRSFRRSSRTLGFPKNVAPNVLPAVLIRLVGIVLVLCCSGPSRTRAELVLPDLIGLQQQPNILHGWRLDSQRQPGHVLLRFNVQIPNIGDGPMEVRTVNRAGEGLQDIYQRIYDSSGSILEQLVGTFPITPSPHGGLNLVGIAEYSLRSVTANDGVGAALATNLKTSRCLVDSVVFDASLPAAPPASQYVTCHSDVYGISVGRADLYSDYFENQWIDVTGVQGGRYWLEATVDPFNRIQEIDDTNNTARILIDLPAAIPEPSAAYFLILASLPVIAVTACRHCRRRLSPAKIQGRSIRAA